MTTDPVAFLLQYVAWVMLFAVLAVNWAGVIYPSGRANAEFPLLGKIHPRCLNQIFVDPRYEGSVSLGPYHSDFQSEPMKLVFGFKALLVVLKTGGRL